jgi:hypothetical protein
VPSDGEDAVDTGTLFLLRQERTTARRVTLFHRGARVDFGSIDAGSPNRSAEARRVNGGVGGVNFLELELPPGALLAARLGHGDSEKGTPGARYFLKDETLEKEMDLPGDLIVQTRNEVLNTRLLYWCAIATTFVVGCLTPRFASLRFPEESERDDLRAPARPDRSETAM